jgi:hypothetical protein
MSESVNAGGDSFGVKASRTVRGAILRVILTILIPLAWISVTLLFVAFWAGGFSVFQDLVVFVVSMLALFGVVAGMWIAFGLRTARRWVDW